MIHIGYDGIWFGIFVTVMATIVAHRGQSPILFCAAQCTACTRLLTRILRNRL